MSAGSAFGKPEAACYLTLPTAPSPVTTHCEPLACVFGDFLGKGAGAPLGIGSWEQPSWEDGLRVTVEKEVGHWEDGAITVEGEQRGVRGLGRRDE
jgi:hypothetical protein